MDRTQMESLPPELQPFSAQLQQSQLPCVNITAIPGKTALSQSKFLGLPYLPTTESYPIDSFGSPMLLLAQLNFSEIPELPGYPRQGILQIFVSASEDVGHLYGADLSSFESMQVQKGFQLRYYAPSQLEQPCIIDFEFLRDLFADKSLCLPLEWECELTFAASHSIPSPDDYRFAKQMGEDFFENFGDKADELRESYWQEFSGQGHRVGGYAYFTQEDPRLSAPEGEEWLLLLQIDSDDAAGIMWGDVGVAGFFIRPEDLARHDFSRVVYSWDCC